MLLLRRSLQQSNTTKLKSFTIPQTTCTAEGTKVEESPQEFVDDAESFTLFSILLMGRQQACWKGERSRLHKVYRQYWLKLINPDKKSTGVTNITGSWIAIPHLITSPGLETKYRLHN